MAQKMGGEVVTNFFESYSFIFSFFALTFLFNMLLGAKFTEYFLLLVLLSMIVLNGDKFASVFRGLKGE